VSEQNAEQISGETGSVSAEPGVANPSDAQSEPVAASAQDPTEVKSPDLVPEQGGAGETSKVNAPKADVNKADVHKADAHKPNTHTGDAPPASSKVMIMSSGDRGWDSDADPQPKSRPSSGMLGKRRLAALAAVVALAAMAGALGGALATAGVGHLVGDDATASRNRALEASIARIDADILALKASVEHTSKVGMSQFNKTSDRLDKVEKAQAEPAAKLAKLSDAVDKLRAAPAAVAAAPSAAKEVTGSISPPATAAPATAPKVEVARLPTVEGWVLREVANGGALIEGRQGIYEVYAGDPLPGLGRVDAIRRQDGRWVVVTSKGLIVAR
jgi:hypothetical protein